jgi:hypothetical protein
MIKLDKLLYIKNELERIISPDEIISAAFDGCPELVEFSFRKSNEYDDNNYSDHLELLYVNGHRVDYNGDYEEEDEEYDEERKKSSLPKLPNWVGSNLVDLIHEVGNEWDYSDEITVSRENYKNKKSRNSKEDKESKRYLCSHLSGKRLPESFFIKCSNPKLPLYYAVEHGRFSSDAEFKIFAKEGRMWYALRYAQEIIGGVLPEQIENFFLLNDKAETEDHERLQEYIAWKNTLQMVETTKEM